MKHTFDISDELIARYVDNQVTKFERDSVLRSLCNHPDELENLLVLTTAVSMLENDQRTIIRMPLKSGLLNRIDGIINSAAAFAPQQENNNDNATFSVKGSESDQIWKRLVRLSKEIEKI